MKTQAQLIKEITEGDKEVIKTTTNGVIFTEDGPEGYFSKQEFVSELLKRKGTSAIRHLTNLFNNMAIAKDLRELPEKSNADGESLIWVKFHNGRVKQSLPVPVFGSMEQMLLDYANGKLKGTKPFQQLLEDATRDYQE